jgi:predicted transcriptional regulator
MFILEKAGLVDSRQIPASGKGTQKICSLKYEKVMIPLFESTCLGQQTPGEIETEMPIGLFSDFSVTAPCGIISDNGVIGLYDNPNSFLDPRRASAGLIWFSYGFLEYRFPKNFTKEAKIKSISFSGEICSEYPGHNNSWPSDITLWINGVETGTWTSPGDMGGERGSFTPAWWNTNDSQYGFLKTWNIDSHGTWIDHTKISAMNISSLNIHAYDSISIRIGVKEDAVNRGGLNVFGAKFGNFAQDLKLVVSLE